MTSPRDHRKLLIVSWYGTRGADAGEKVRLLNLVNSLQSHHNVQLVAFDDDESVADGEVRPPKPLRKRYRVSRMSYALALISGQSLEAWILSFNPIRRYWMKRLIERTQPDVIICNQPYSFHLIPRSWRARVIVDTHNVNSARLSRIAKTQRSGLLRFAVGMQSRACRRDEEAIVQQAGQIWVVSEMDLKNLPLLGQSKIFIVPNGANFEPRGVSDSSTVSAGLDLVFFGKLDYSANVDAVERTVSWLKDASGSWRSLRLVGSGDPDAVGQIISGDPRFILTGRVEKPSDAFRGASALIALHRQGGGSRLKIVEATASGLPIIATSVAAEGIPLNPFKDYFRVETSAELASLLAAWNPREADDRAKSAKSRLREFDWALIGQRAAELVTRLDC